MAAEPRPWIVFRAEGTQAAPRQGRQPVHGSSRAAPGGSPQGRTGGARHGDGRGRDSGARRRVGRMGVVRIVGRGAALSRLPLPLRTGAAAGIPQHRRDRRGGDDTKMDRDAIHRHRRRIRRQDRRDPQDRRCHEAFQSSRYIQYGHGKRRLPRYGAHLYRSYDAGWKDARIRRRGRTEIGTGYRSRQDWQGHVARFRRGRADVVFAEMVQFHRSSQAGLFQAIVLVCNGQGGPREPPVDRAIARDSRSVEGSL